MTKARTLADNYAADINQVSAGVGITGGGTSGTVTITNDMATSINAKGDLVVGTANDTYSRLAVASTAGYVLTVDSAEATGLKWGAVAAGSNWSLLNSGGTALSGSQTVTISSISNKDKIMVVVDAAETSGTAADVYIRINGVTTGDKYKVYGGFHEGHSTYQFGDIANSTWGQGYTNGIPLGRLTSSTNSSVNGGVTFTGCNASGVKQFIAIGGTRAAGQYNQRNNYSTGWVDESSTVSSISVYSSNGNFDGGTVYVYASA